MNYIVVECHSCGNIALAKKTQKTRLCPFCGKRNRLENTKILAITSSLQEAKEIIFKLRIQKNRI